MEGRHATVARSPRCRRRSLQAAIRLHLERGSDGQDLSLTLQCEADHLVRLVGTFEVH
jgi:hypothetical protein